MKRVTILGSTGSIGGSALDFISSANGDFKAICLTANSSVERMMEQILKFQPEVVAMADVDSANSLFLGLRSMTANERRCAIPEILSGESGVCEAAAYPESDIVLSSIVGSSGLMPTLSAIRAGKDIAIANKETLVMAGELVRRETTERRVRLLPVDSEHNAIFQCLEGRDYKDVRRAILTASGGPFFGYDSKRLEHVTVRDALNHPNWSMGSKITIDSATLMNKGLEVIEAHHLFGFAPSEIDVLIHPQSIVHSMIEFIDGGILAQISVPDMKGPIAYALTYPDRADGVMNRCSLQNLSNLSFHEPDFKTFPALTYAYEALKEGGTMPAVINAANEELVGLFLKEVIKFNDIPAIIDYVMQRHDTQKAYDIGIINESDGWARRIVRDRVRP